VIVAVLLTSVVLGLSAPALLPPNSVAQVPLFVEDEQLLPEITVPATLVIETDPFEKVLLGLVVVAVKLASVPPPTAVVSTPAPSSPKRIILIRLERSLFVTKVSWFIASPPDVGV
jgi:hypothetical protein